MVGKLVKASEVIPLGMRAIMPKTLRDANAKYVKVDGETVKVLNFIAVNVYNAKNEDGTAMVTKTGNPILNKTIYLGFDDGSFTTLKNDVALSQVFGIVGEFDIAETGSFEFPIEEPFVVGFEQTKIKMGKKEYDYWVMKPVE